MVLLHLGFEKVISTIEIRKSADLLIIDGATSKKNIHDTSKVLLFLKMTLGVTQRNYFTKRKG